MKVECPVQGPGGLAMCSHGHSFCTICRVKYLHHWLNSPCSFHSFLSSGLLLLLEGPRHLKHPCRGMLSWENDWCSRAISVVCVRFCGQLRYCSPSRWRNSFWDSSYRPSAAHPACSRLDLDQLATGVTDTERPEGQPSTTDEEMP